MSTYDDEDEDIVPVYNGPWSVAIYLVDRAYGGPEEGGWWYTYGEPEFYICPEIPAADQVKIFDDKDKAYEWRDELQTKLDATANVGRREISSMASTGRYQAHLAQGMPKYFPQRRPHYE